MLPYIAGYYAAYAQILFLGLRLCCINAAVEQLMKIKGCILQLKLATFQFGIVKKIYLRGGQNTTYSM